MMNRETCASNFFFYIVFLSLKILFKERQGNFVKFFLITYVNNVRGSRTMQEMKLYNFILVKKFSFLTKLSRFFIYIRIAFKFHFGYKFDIIQI